jgi:hypothetical protein
MYISDQYLQKSLRSIHNMFIQDKAGKPEITREMREFLLLIVSKTSLIKGVMEEEPWTVALQTVA